MLKKTSGKNPAAVSLGRKGGKNSRANLPPEQRTELAKKAAAARWVKKTTKKAVTRKGQPKAEGR